MTDLLKSVCEECAQFARETIEQSRGSGRKGFYCAHHKISYDVVVVDGRIVQWEMWGPCTLVEHRSRKIGGHDPMDATH